MRWCGFRQSFIQNGHGFNAFENNIEPLGVHIISMNDHNMNDISNTDVRVADKKINASEAYALKLSHWKNFV